MLNKLASTLGNIILGGVFAALPLASVEAQSARPEIIRADICVYGGTSSGVVAAVQAARMGKRVVLVEPGLHLGGLSSGGLTATDIGKAAAIGGISREFYRRLGQHYGKTEQWNFEPHVAEDTYFQMINEAKAAVYLGQHLLAVHRVGPRITEIVMQGGKIFRAPMFIDASYEGDLMAGAGVSYTIGREPNSLYHETLNGVRANTPHHNFLVKVDPYVRPGDPSSGLLPFIQPGGLAPPGSGDREVQAYNYRLCFTHDKANQIPITPGPHYNPKQFALLGRYLRALVRAGRQPHLNLFLSIRRTINGKTDVNNNGAISTDFIGQNYAYPDANEAERERIRQAHEEYTRDFLHYLATSTNAPPSLRHEMQSWGLAADEFTDNHGWPTALYIREARRMIGAYVMTEHNCRGEVVAPDSIGLGSYNMDSHNCQRIVRDGHVENEGDVEIGVTPYPISYRCLTPKQTECENLLVSVCVSATHIAYGSIRMEPVFMILGQSAATAAALALDEQVPVQKVDYSKLRARLLADHQILTWTRPKADLKHVIIDPKSLPGIVLDDTQGKKKGPWLTSSSTDIPRLGPSYLHDNNAHKGEVSITYQPDIPRTGRYEIIISSPPHDNRARQVPVTVKVEGMGQVTVPVNQRIRAHRGLTSIGVFLLPKGKRTTITLSNRDTKGYVVADGVEIVPVKK